LFNIVPIARERVGDSMTDGMIVLDKQSRIVDVNPTAERMIGQPLDQILSQPVSNIFADYAELFSRYRNKDELHDEIVIGEGRSCRTLDLRLSPLFDRHHQRQGTLVVLRDITERKQTETALQASEERFRHLTLNSPDMIYILNLPTYQTEFINKQEFLGYTLDELQQPGSILNQIHPDDLASATVFWQTLSEDKDNGKNTIEYQVRHKDGHWEWILNRVLVLSRTPAGAPEQLLVILTLITNSKQAEDKLRQHEERLRILVEQAPIGIVTVDMAGNVTDANPRSLELLGSPGKEATIGLNVLTLPSLISAGISPLLERVLTTGQMEELETWYTSIWEKSDYLFIRAVPYSDGHRQQIGLIILVEDLTQRAHAEEGLRQMQKMESLSVLAGGIAHAFNNLLVAMMGQTSLALKKMLPENPGRPHVEKAVTAAEHAARLTQQLLAYSGRGQFETHLLQLNTLIEENNHLFQVTVSKNVQLQTKLTPSLPLIEADIGQIQQVVMNLIINAAEAIGEHSGTVTISTGTSEIKDGNKPLWRHAGPPLASGLYVTLSVRDNGGGMDEETLAKIFDPFFTTKFTGRGLGLAAVLGIVRGHKGGLQVDSQVGRGTTFKLYFPASVEQPIEESAPALASAAAGTQGCILVIDDEESVREAVSDILIGEGLEVITAANGEEGLALYVEHQAEIQLVLLDLSMPGLSGAETAVKLQQMNPDVLILLSSGYHQSEVAHKFTNLKVAGFLQKPYDATRLVKTIQRYLK
ncbi:MAG: PAS domain-containing sensor histidine kinase, partial [Chloroflexi bacterium]